jgi:hypothetical protein
MSKRFLFIAFLAIMFGCGGGDAKPDAAVDAFFTKCGAPGDQGNELGIGKYCGSISDCNGTMAPLCSSLGDKDTHFCTKTCPMGSTTACGTGAECVCNAGNQCGCTPSACLGP